MQVMRNGFLVEGCRFHAKERNKLLIKGWFEDETAIKDHQIEIYLDNNKLDYSIEKNVNTGIALTAQEKGKAPIYIYSFWVSMPEDFGDAKALKVIDCYDGDRKVVYQVSGAKLKRKQMRLDKFIEGGRVTEDGFRIKGWCIQLHEVKFQVQDEKGQIVPVEIKKRRRADTLFQFPECIESEIFCFELRYKGEVPKRVTVYLDDGERKAQYSVTLKPSTVKKGVQKVKEYGKKTYRYTKQFGVSHTAKRALIKLQRKDMDFYNYWRKQYGTTKKQLKEQKNTEFPVQPKMSIVVPLYKTPEEYLKKMIASVEQQTYSNWELCLSDGSGADSPLTELLNEYEKKDSRIRVVRNEMPLQISDNTNQALDIVTGDWIAFMDHDDTLTHDALYECVKAINEDPEIDMIYSDEDKISMDGKEFFQPHFKSDFNIDMLRGTNYFCHLTVVKKELYQKAGNLQGEYDGAQDYDFVLRCVEHARKVKHIPRVLYHWRAHKDSTAENPESKLYAFEAGARAVQAHYDRVGIHAKVESTKYLGIYRSKYYFDERPLVSIIIPNKDHIEDLDKCISALEGKATYKNLEYIIVENNSEKEETFEYYEALKQKNPKVQVVTWEGAFNYSAINNFGVSYAKGDFYLFLNNDTEIINEDCIEELLGYCLRPDVGAVGARLFYEDGTIQHAGVIIGLQGVAGHPCNGEPHESPGYFGRAIIAHDCSAVTAACVMVKRQVFEEVGGFDPKLAVAFNDIDFCLKIRKAGYLIVYNPYAQLYHYESKSRGQEDTEEKIRRFQGEIETFHEKWYDVLLKGDPYYNPNLTLTETNFGLRP